MTTPTIHKLDAAGQSLGRIASRAAVLLRGKDVPTYEPRILPKVKVEISNIGQMVFKGTKAQSTKYYRHSGYPGGIREMTLEEKWARHPAEVVRLAVRGMLPPNRTRDRLLRNLIISQ
jgi:large subunit ribosomal protein L13